MGNTILLADKSITIQKIVQLTFADDNYVIQCVSDGQAAVEAIPQLRPDLILADISLPLKNGYDVCKAVRTDAALAAFSNVPVILLAGIYETMDEERARQVEERVKEVHANDFLSKPFDPQVLIAKVKKYMGGHAETPMPAPGPESMFAEVSSPADAMFSESFETPDAEQPPDDGERTMMIPGGISFASNMFAEPLPYEEQPAGITRPPVDVDAVKPVGEPVFEADEMEQLEAEASADTEVTQLVEPPTFDEIGGPFAGREEQEFELPDEPTMMVTARTEEMPLIMPESEDPFGEDLTASSPAVSWGTATVSDEDAPFGVPEPPAPEPLFIPEPEPEPEPLEPLEMEMAPPIPEALPEPIEVVHGKVEAGFEPPPDYDDTWPGVPSGGEQPVEDLFEAEPVKTIEDVEELEADVSEAVAQPAIEEITAPQEPAPAVDQPALSTDITDALVEKIAERVVAKLTERFVSEIVWQVVPDLAEKMIRREIEKLHEGEQ